MAAVDQKRQHNAAPCRAEPYCQIAANAAEASRIERPALDQRAEKGHQRRLHLKEAEADDQDRDTTAIRRTARGCAPMWRGWTRASDW
jgi:hypothetical protein